MCPFESGQGHHSAVQQASLTDAPPASAIASAASWIGDLLFGPLATGIAVVAIAWIGLAMLAGRIDLRRGAAVVLGCFLLFGPRGIAEGLKASAANLEAPTIASVPPAPVLAQPSPVVNSGNAYDPYAGAAVMQPGQ